MHSGSSRIPVAITIISLLVIAILVGGVAFKYKSVISTYCKNRNQNVEMKVSFKKSFKQSDDKGIPVKDFCQMMKDRVIPDKAEYSKINMIDNRKNVLPKSKEAGVLANKNAEISPNRY